MTFDLVGLGAALTGASLAATVIVKFVLPAIKNGKNGNGFDTRLLYDLHRDTNNILGKMHELLAVQNQKLDTVADGLAEHRRQAAVAMAQVADLHKAS